ncbi:hypothetical protein V6N13_059640 [Hibiscus sabdariffa]
MLWNTFIKRCILPTSHNTTIDKPRVPHLPSDVLTPQRTGWTRKEYLKRMHVQEAEPQAYAAASDNKGIPAEQATTTGNSSPTPTSRQLDRMEAR